MRVHLRECLYGAPETKEVHRVDEQFEVGASHVTHRCKRAIQGRNWTGPDFSDRLEPALRRHLRDNSEAVQRQAKIAPRAYGIDPLRTKRRREVQIARLISQAALAGGTESLAEADCHSMVRHHCEQLASKYCIIPQGPVWVIFGVI